MPIRKASIGNITKKDYTEAESNYEKDPLISVILGFNVADESGVSDGNVKILTNDIIYRLVLDFEEWQEGAKKSEEEKKLDKLVRPAKLEILHNCIFRQSNPCIAGVEVMVGTIKIGTPVMKDGRYLADVKSMQADKESVQKLEKGKQAAVSLPHVTAGRQINEGDIIYSDIPEDDFRQMKKLTQFLSKDEVSVLKEIAEIHRKENPVWGV